MKKFNSNHLKLIAIIAMTIDHIADLIYPGMQNNIISIILHIIGRLTAPIMFFFICEGFYYTKNLSDIGDNNRPGIVHRLDKDTSGLMLVAKENKTHEILSEEFKKHNIHREYVALVDGVIEVSMGTIDAPIKRSKENYQKMTVASGGKNAITHFEVIKKYSNNTLIRLILETGRTHQIRVHMAYIGYPIHNDPVYNKKESTAFGQFLHSEYLRFIHPITKEKLEFRCDLPKEFQDYLNILEEHN